MSVPAYCAGGASSLASSSSNGLPSGAWIAITMAIIVVGVLLIVGAVLLYLNKNNHRGDKLLERV